MVSVAKECLAIFRGYAGGTQTTGEGVAQIMPFLIVFESLR